MMMMMMMVMMMMTMLQLLLIFLVTMMVMPTPLLMEVLTSGLRIWITWRDKKGQQREQHQLKEA